MKECEMFDTMSNQSKKIASLNQSCIDSSCFMLGDRLFKWGGRTVNDKLFNWNDGVEEYSIKDNLWRVVSVAFQDESLRSAMRPLILSSIVRVSPKDAIVLGGTDEAGVD
jgi:hypothetical protein